ncbi:Geranylgeranyl transferase type-2 subunit alpha [Neolecta irregularis DAH-3]|uniref:Geranylgeranyl transferase type-2 subunit alpha n=1 Tax=Neolecta irregularis (strain DAH-3) TaxID=1198029 RepID=A0A1U7LI99_NEOID|nr:Geranylgeranyl transferase type-2 subunit alpha [Neolecta irregularis DAH-3]|eukprot:OLL22386.1 Geranylgeranyl transferase type-2 subunit alpha [Neolecta irregularis DAH-3]
MNATAADELDFTQQMISKNLSNFSAWHVRSSLLPKYFCTLDSVQQHFMLRKEIDLIKAAIYTDPDDQSIWLYYRWLRSTFDIKEDETMLGELFDLEPNCKWVLIGVSESKQRKGQDDLGILDKLIQIDPLRKGRYKEMMTKKSISQ